jgi:hypothetical protein
MKLTKKEIDSILGGYECDSYNRFQTFINLIPKLEGKNYWYALASSYKGSDNLFNFSGLVKHSFSKDEPNKEFLMTTSERKYLKNLPEQITIYRGMTENELKKKNFGLSWSLKKEVAEFFANTYARNHGTNHLTKTVHELSINKNEVIAFFSGRNEFEIIYIYK